MIKPIRVFKKTMFLDFFFIIANNDSISKNRANGFLIKNSNLPTSVELVLVPLIGC